MPSPPSSHTALKRWVGASRSGRSNVHIRHDLSVRRRRRWPHPHAPIVPPSSAAAGAARPATRSLPTRSSDRRCANDEYPPSGSLGTVVVFAFAFAFVVLRRRVTRSGCVGPCAGVGATRARRRRFRHRRRGEHVEDTQRRRSSRRPPRRRPSSPQRTTTQAIGRAGSSRSRSRSQRPSFHEADAGEDRGGPSNDGSLAEGARRDRCGASGIAVSRTTMAVVARPPPTADGGARRRRRRRRRPVGTRRPSSRRGRGRASGFRAHHRGRVSRRYDPADAIAGASSGWTGDRRRRGAARAEETGGRIFVDDRGRRSSAPHRPRVRRRPGASGAAIGAAPPANATARGGGPRRESPSPTPPRGVPDLPCSPPPASRGPGGGSAFSPTMADRSSVAVRRRHPRSPLDQLLSEERLGRTTRRRSHSQSKEVALL